MVLDKLGRSLHSALTKITKAGRIDEKAVKSLVKDIQRSLLQADVKVQLVLDLTKRIEKRALEEEIPKGVSRKEHLIKIVYEELSSFLGEPGEIKLEGKKPKVALMVGLQGSGKTTSAAKLAEYYKKRGYKVGLVCADTYRPGAYEQIQQLGEEVGVPVHGDPEEDNAVELAVGGVSEFREDPQDLILIDSAGRHRKEENLMKEMKEISRKISPDEIILVIDGTLGQQAEAQAAAFNEATDIGSILITKLDGTAKGGGALSAVAATGAPIKFIGTGEKIGELELFKPERFVARLLGMGDIETLLEKIRETTEPEEIESERMKAIMAGKLSLRDVYEQLEKLSDMGPLKKMLQMLPGVGMSLPEDQIQVGKDKLNRFKVIMKSMTDEELDDPKILNRSRIKRIAEGSGTTEGDVKELLDQYENMQKLMKSFSKERAPQMKKLRKFFKQMPKDM
ncbi:signal recognition particle [candidate division MSBL1 archaeon SCGC-AAA261O19]|uniref:Signal recognition particle 54 kDa protein n=2 Tax=candidate division MSBL1 TaxID=215777 RepID=A0A133V2F3_9EURY|nr:signal recognition particle [candidate division MSBL1 archaeon SCGC-AAA261C02]KXB04987.1 signal recognition particle [candidate division MSBL1 archaeon SCGC-AAA261O19]